MVTLQALRRDVWDDETRERLVSRAWLPAYLRSSALMTIQLTVSCKVTLFVE